MGIQGLLPLVNSVTRDGHIKQYSGKKVAVDGYSWLHRGSYSCSADLALGKPTTMYIEFCMQRIKMMQFHGVTPVIVFDGRSLPMKAGTDKERSMRRKEYLAKGKAFWENGNKTLAFECFQRCTDVTGEMAYAFIKVLQFHMIEYVVAPYEADAQLAYLARNNKVHAVVTEDSDLIVFGCPRIFVKMDRDGHGKEVLLSSLGDLTEINCTGWSDETFRKMCILSGCDYLPSVQGIGLKTAHKLLRQHKSIEAIVAFMRTDKKKFTVPDRYLFEFKRAEMTFCYQRVYDPTTQTLVMLNPWDAKGMEMLESLLGCCCLGDQRVSAVSIDTLTRLHTEDPLGLTDFLGPLMSAEITVGIARGDLHPRTLQPMASVAMDTDGSRLSTEEEKRMTLERKPRALKSSASASAKLGCLFESSQENNTCNPFVKQQAFFQESQRPQRKRKVLSETPQGGEKQVICIDSDDMDKENTGHPSVTVFFKQEKEEKEEEVDLEEESGLYSQKTLVADSQEECEENKRVEIKKEYDTGCLGNGKDIPVDDSLVKEEEEEEEEENIKNGVTKVTGSSLVSLAETLKARYSHPLGLQESKHTKHARSARADLHQVMTTVTPFTPSTTRLTLKREILSPDTPPPSDKKTSVSLSDKLSLFKYKAFTPV